MPKPEYGFIVSAEGLRKVKVELPAGQSKRIWVRGKAKEFAGDWSQCRGTTARRGLRASSAAVASIAGTDPVHSSFISNAGGRPRAAENRRDVWTPEYGWANHWAAVEVHLRTDVALPSSSRSTQFRCCSQCLGRVADRSAHERAGLWGVTPSASRKARSALWHRRKIPSWPSAALVLPPF